MPRAEKNKDTYRRESDALDEFLSQPGQDVHAFVDHDVAFHRRIVEASGNGTLGELWGSLHVDLRTTITLITLL